MWLLLVASALADCPSRTADVDAGIVEAEAAFGALDLAGFEAARGAVRADLGCLSELVPARLAARVHGVDAIAAIVAKDDAAALASIRSARASDPSWTLPSAVPEGHRLRALYAEAPTAAGPTEPIVVPQGTHALVDGRPSDLRPTDRPFLMVLEDDGGHVVWSSLVGSGEPVPDLSRFAVAPAPAPVAAPRRSVRPALAVTSAVAALGSGVLLGLAASSASRFADEGTPYEDLDGLRSRANAMTIAGGAGIGVTLAFGAATGLALREAP